ncbi:MAG: hypothetical protein ACOX6V_02000 [Patescibacteria group bacterium]|jgi:hypothetical protein
MTRWCVLFCVLVTAVLLIGCGTFFDGDAVTVNSEAYGFFNPYCYGDEKFERWNSFTISQMCKSVLAPSTEGVIEKGGDYDTAFLNGCARVVFQDGQVLWVPTKYLEKGEE